MKFGFGINISADVTKDSTKIGADAVLTHEGVVEAGQAGMLSAAEGLKSLAARVKDADLKTKAAKAVEATGSAITAGATKVTEFTAEKTPAVMGAVGDGLHKLADKIETPKALPAAEAVDAQ